MHILRTLTIHDTIYHRRTIARRSQLTSQRLFQHIPIIQRINQSIHHMRLLFRKMHQLRNIITLIHFRQTRHAPLLCNHQPHILKRINIPINRPRRSLQKLRQLINRIIPCTRHQLHQAQHPFNLWLIHNQYKKPIIQSGILLYIPTSIPSATT